MRNRSNPELNQINRAEVTKAQLKNMKYYAKALGRYYAPLHSPVPDDETLVDLGDRLIFKHGSPTRPESGLHVAPQHVLTAGWVLGIFEPEVAA